MINYRRFNRASYGKLLSIQIDSALLISLFAYWFILEDVANWLDLNYYVKYAFSTGASFAFFFYITYKSRFVLSEIDKEEYIQSLLKNRNSKLFGRNEYEIIVYDSPQLIEFYKGCLEELKEVDRGKFDQETYNKYYSLIDELEEKIAVLKSVKKGLLKYESSR